MDESLPNGRVLDLGTEAISTQTLVKQRFSLKSTYVMAMASRDRRLIKHGKQDAVLVKSAVPKPTQLLLHLHELLPQVSGHLLSDDRSSVRLNEIQSQKTIRSQNLVVEPAVEY